MPDNVRVFLVNFTILGLSTIVTMTVFSMTSRDGGMWPILMFFQLLTNAIYAAALNLMAGRALISNRVTVICTFGLAAVLLVYQNLRVLANILSWPLAEFYTDNPALLAVMTADLTLYALYAVPVTVVFIIDRCMKRLRT